MFIPVSEIELNGKKIPYKIDNYVLAAIQSAYGTIVDFEMKLMGWAQKNGKLVIVGEPSAEVINKIFPVMVSEGYACMNKDCPYTDAEIVRLIDKQPLEMANTIHEELIACMTGKKKDLTPRKRTPRTQNK